MEYEGHPLAEETTRLLAGAANAARLYPESSELPTQAVVRFLERANEVTNSIGPLRYVIDPHEIKIGDMVIGAGQSQMTSFAETLHAMQVGQLVIAPGVEAPEVVSFVRILNSDPTEVRQKGMRALLGAAGVTHIAVIEVTLRASTEEGILGLDLTTAPLDEIGKQTVAVAEKWSSTAAESQGMDDMREALGRLEEATRDIAAARVAEALLRLDEATRMRVLALSLQGDSTGSRMQGMFDVIAQMSPSALARLLSLVAMQAGVEPSRMASAMSLPPEVAEQIMMLLAPSPCSEADCGIHETPAPEQIQEELSAPDDQSDLEALKALSAPSLSSGRALVTTVAISRISPDIDSIRAIAQALPGAARDGSFEQVREALRRLDELDSDASLDLEVQQARAALQDPAILTDVCRAPINDAGAAMAGEILKAAGAAGAEALLTFYIEASETQKSLFGPVIRGMGESLLTVAGRRIRTGDSSSAIAVIRLMPLLGDKRVVPLLLQALENLDAEVRRTAIAALADLSGNESKAALVKALSHWDPETRRFAIREIGRVRAENALPALVRILEDINFLERNHELKKEVIKSLESIGSADALPVLKRWARRRFVIGRRNKELSHLAKRAVEHLSEHQR
ncbi:MAG: HEAT repeat domain-containing protein [Coriobacteriia bacterium]